MAVAIGSGSPHFAGDHAGATPFDTSSYSFTAGSLIIVCVYTYDPGAGNPTVSSVQLDGSTAFTQDLTRQNATGDSRLYIFSLENVAGGSHTIRVNKGNAADTLAVYTIEVTGAATTSPRDGVGASATNSGANPASGNFTASVSDGFWVGHFGNENSATDNTVSNGSGWSFDSTNGRNTNPQDPISGVEWRANPGSPGAFNADFVAASAAWAAGVFVYKAAAGGATKPPTNTDWPNPTPKGTIPPTQLQWRGLQLRDQFPVGAAQLTLPTRTLDTVPQSFLHGRRPFFVDQTAFGKKVFDLPQYPTPVVPPMHSQVRKPFYVDQFPVGKAALALPPMAPATVPQVFLKTDTTLRAPAAATNPFLPTDWPVPQARRSPMFDQAINILMPTLIVTPFVQSDWSVPSRRTSAIALLTDLGSRKPYYIDQAPLSQQDWPVPKGTSTTPPSWLFYYMVDTSVAPPFAQTDWPLPMRRMTATSLLTDLGSRKFYYVDQKPFVQNDWPLPSVRVASIGLPFDLEARRLMLVEPQPFSQDDWPIPIRRVEAMGLTFDTKSRRLMLVEPVPVTQTDWPLPTRQVSAIGLMTDLESRRLMLRDQKPFVQNDWPLPAPWQRAIALLTQLESGGLRASAFGSILATPDVIIRIRPDVGIILVKPDIGSILE